MTPARADLLALSEAGLTQLSNAGLVKRGLRDMAAGTGPTLAEVPDGTVEARFADGVVTRLPPGRPPTDAACTCPASGMCRHRVTLVLAYQQARAGVAQPGPPGWDPATLDGAAFEASLPAAARADLARLLASAMAVRLERGPVPVARLPMATVRFLVPGELSYARCDCAAISGCAHVALAVRGFQASSGASEAALGGAPARVEASGLAAAVDAVLLRLLQVGVVAGMAAHGRGLDRATAAAEALGAVQLVLVLQDLAEQVAAYEARSAHYDEAAVLDLAAELFARTRAVDAGAALGLGEPMESAMAKARLVSLGARMVAQGPDLAASAIMADTDTGSVLLLHRRFVAGDAPLTVADAASRSFAPGLAVRGVAHGQILTSVARRRMDGLLRLGSGTGGRTALMGRAPMQEFVSPLRASQAGAVLEAFASRAPRLLRPRNLVEDVHVFPVASVLGQSWLPGAQTWRAAVELPHGGGTVFLERQHDAGAPGALDVLSAAANGRHGTVRQVAGTVRVENGAVVCTPWSLVADRLLVPDFDAPNGPESDAPAAATDAGPASAPSQARQLLAGALHASQGRGAPARGARVAAALHTGGYAMAGQRIEAWLAAAPGNIAPFCHAAVWVLVVLEG